MVVLCGGDVVVLCGGDLVVLCEGDMVKQRSQRLFLKTHLLMLDQDGIASYGSRETTSPSFSGYMHVTDSQKLEDLETSTSKVSH